ncbi:MAG TPA: glucose 1-dehydrogenase [Alphaproteobacteria bacterium]|nr:glucose 1-dehydrogenase [Alphaproteobacteria bacterium]
MARVEGKIALVTGAARGIGRATAQALAREGAVVTVTDLSEEDAARTAAELGGGAEGLAQDVRSADDWARVVGHVMARHGRLDILVNNAGILATRDTQVLEDTDMEQWRAVQTVNVEGVFLGCKQAVPAMAKGGGGSIVNLSSIAGLVGTPHVIAYGASKGAVRQLTKSVAAYCGRKGWKIRCNSVHPGVIDTDMGDQVLSLGGADLEETKRQRAKMIPLQELGRAEDVANCILFLASDEARYVTGAELVVDGGYTTL